MYFVLHVVMWPSLIPTPYTSMHIPYQSKENFDIYIKHYKTITQVQVHTQNILNNNEKRHL